MKPLIYDNDAALDDFFALCGLLSMPEQFSLKAVTVCGTGEATGYIGAQNMLRMCRYFNFKNIPVAFGRSQPLDRNGKPFPDFMRKAQNNLLNNKGIPEVVLKIWTGC